MVDAGDLTCSQSSLEANFTTNLSYPLEYSLRVLQIVYAFVILIGGILLNTFAAFLIVKTNTLRTHSFFVAVQLCLSNVVLAIFFSLPVIISNIADEWMMPTEICIASGFVIFSLTTLRNALIFVLYWIDLHQSFCRSGTVSGAPRWSPYFAWCRGCCPSFTVSWPYLKYWTAIFSHRQC